MKNEKIKHGNVDDYISDFPEAIQSVLEEIRDTIRKAAPDALEMISYGIPAFKFKGKPLVYFAAFKNHIGFYPTPTGVEEFEKELSVYKQGKGSVQFPLDKPMPLKLIGKIVKFRMGKIGNEFGKKEKIV
jgi:uncharacterized protein YdhG (YjbR/CyaY superfamily)